MVRDLLQQLVDSTGLNVSTETVTIGDAAPILNTRLRAAEVAAAALGAQAALICDIWKRRTGRRQTATVDMEGAALALQSVFHQRQWKYPVMTAEPQYPTIRIYPTNDGRHVMINGGYPDLRDGLLDLLKCADTEDEVAKAVGGWEAETLETAAVEKEFGTARKKKGLCAVMVRTPQEWRDHKQGRALRDRPVVEIIKIADGPRVPFPQPAETYPPSGLRPLSGLRVLDLTHVIAGPTCAKTLAEQGATVLHVYAPDRPQLQRFDLDTGHGKLSAFLDLKAGDDFKTLREILKLTDVFSQSYRPGALDKFHLTAEELAELRPGGIVVVSCNCYGFGGPWDARPGFEQLAQAATGIATTKGTLEKPLLIEDFYPNDYITGFLAALGTLAALIRRSEEGGSYHVRVSLCRTAMLLLDQGLHASAAAEPKVPAAILARYMQEMSSPFGRLHFLGPVLRYSETPSRWDLPPVPLGAHPPRWPDWA